MTKKNFEVNDKIGRYTLTEFAGTNPNGEPLWWALRDNGNRNEGLVPESRLRKELRLAELTPEFINGLSAKAFDELLKEVGQDAIDQVLKNRRPKHQAPSYAGQHEIAAKWFSWHPQVPKTRSNSELFDSYLQDMTNPSFTSKDFDAAFADLFFKLELNPVAAGIEGLGDGIRGENEIRKLTSTQIAQLQKSFPVKPTVDFSKLSQDEVLVEVAKVTNLREFDQFVKDVDREKGIEAPVPPLLVEARQKMWSGFFQIHRDLLPTEELQIRILEILSENNLPVLNQHLETALDFLIQANDPVVQRQDSGTWSSGGSQVGGSQWVVNTPRSHGAPIVIDDQTPVTVSLADITAMGSEEYAKKLLNPQFKKAVDRLYQRFGR